MGFRSIELSAWAKLSACAWLVVSLCTCHAAFGAPTVLNFEDVAPGTAVTAQYGSRGVVFLNHYLGTDPAAHSGTHVLRTADPSSEIFNAIPLSMTFNAPQARVKLFAESQNIPLNGTLTAFDAAGNVVAHDGPKLVAANVFTTMFQVMVSGAPNIVRAELRLENSAYFAMDDLEFDGVPPPPPPLPPVVAFSTPLDGAVLDTETLDIAGTVTGEGLLSPVKLTIIYARPPESTAPPFSSDLELIGTGSTRSFSMPGFTRLPMGLITISIVAGNSGGEDGAATISITNLPAAISSRFTAEGGNLAFGAFRFGLFLQGCRMVMYELGIISVDDGGVTRLVRGPIFSRWLSLRTALHTEGIGCPLAEERDGPDGSRVQDFQSGRIYSHPPIGAFSVPSVFADAIDKRGGEAATGIPIAQPTSSVGIMQTWLFQRFTRPSRPDLVPSTLEIRGTPPRLWIERQSWDLSVATTGTVYEDFACNGNLGPCSVDAPVEPPPIADAENRFCHGTSYPFGDTPEWKAVLGDHISTPLFGVARGSHLAGEDNPFTHEYVYDHDCHIADCPSDWNVSIRPIGPQRNIAPETSIVAENTYVEMEYEAYYANHAHVFMDWPQVGDLFAAAGRWIIDCGHRPRRTELHPVFMYAKMKTEQFQGHLATRADVWVNGWWPGDPINLDIFPPPRPSPDSTLTLNKPLDADAAFNVSLTYSLQPGVFSNHAHVEFTAPIRNVDVTDAGEMKFESGRGYEGQWYIYWSP